METAGAFDGLGREASVRTILHTVATGQHLEEGVGIPLRSSMELLSCLKVPPFLSATCSRHSFIFNPQRGIIGCQKDQNGHFSRSPFYEPPPRRAFCARELIFRSESLRLPPYEGFVRG